MWVDRCVAASAYITFALITYPSSSWGQPGCRATHRSSSHSGVDGTPSRDRLRLQVGGLDQGGGGCVSCEVRPIHI